MRYLKALGCYFHTDKKIVYQCGGENFTIYMLSGEYQNCTSPL